MKKAILLLSVFVISACTGSNPSGTQTNSDPNSNDQTPQIEVDISKVSLTPGLDATGDQLNEDTATLNIGDANGLGKQITAVLKVVNSSSESKSLSVLLNPAQGFSVRINRCPAVMSAHQSCLITLGFINRGLFDGSNYSTTLQLIPTVNVNLIASVSGLPSPVGQPSNIQVSFDHAPSLTNPRMVMTLVNLGPGYATDVAYDIPAGYIINYNRCSTTLGINLPCNVGLFYKDFRSNIFPPLSLFGVTASSQSTPVQISTNGSTGLISMSIGQPTPASGNYLTTFNFPVVYNGADNVTLSESDIIVSGPGSDYCVKTITGAGVNQRIVKLTGCTGNGAVNIQVSAGTGSTLLGTYANAAVSLDVHTLNIGPSITIDPPSNLMGSYPSQFDYTVNYSGATNVTLSEADIILTGNSEGCVKSVSGTGNTQRTVKIYNCSGNGVVGFNIAIKTATDADLNFALNAIAPNITLDNTSPTVTLSDLSLPAISISKTLTFTVSYSDIASESMLSADSILLSGATVGCSVSVTGSGLNSKYFSITGCSGNGNLDVSVKVGAIADMVGNGNSASDIKSVIVDNIPAYISLGQGTPSSGSALTQFSIPVTYASGDSVTLSENDIVITGVTLGCTKSLGGSGINRTINITNCYGNGTISVSVNSGTSTDLAGNAAAATGSVVLAIINPGPAVSFGSPNKLIGNSSTTFQFPVSFIGSTSLTLLPADIVLTGASQGCSVSSITSIVSNSVVRVDVTGCTGNGSLTISVPANVSENAGGGKSLAAGPSPSVTIDNTLPFLSYGPNASPTTGSSTTQFSVPVTYASGDTITLSANDVSWNGATLGCVKTISGTGINRSINITSCYGNGSLNVALNSGTAVDLAGNLAPATGSVVISIVNPGPPVVFGSPTRGSGHSGFTFGFPVSFPGATSVSLSASDVTVTGANAGCIVSIGSVTTNSAMVNVSGCSGNGNMNVSIGANVAVNAGGGKSVASGPSATVIVDNTPPTVAFTMPAVTSGDYTKSFLFTVTYSGYDNSDLSASSLSLTGTGTAGCTMAFSKTNPGLATVTVSGCYSSGTVSLVSPPGVVSDSAGNYVQGAVSSPITITNAGPPIAFGTPAKATGAQGSDMDFPITYYGASMITLTPADVIINGANAGCAVQSATVNSLTSATVIVRGCTGNGNISISLLANTAMNAGGGHSLAAGPSPTSLIDNTPPSVAIVPPVASSGNASSSFVFAVSFSGYTFSNLSSQYIVINGTTAATYGCTKSFVLNSPGSATVTISGCAGNGSVGIKVLAGAVIDSATNQSPDTLSSTVTITNPGPAITFGTPTPALGKSTTSFVFPVNYAGASLITLNSANIIVIGANTGCSPSVSVVNSSLANVTVTGCTGTGLMSISVGANTASNAGGGNSVATGPSPTVSVDNTAPTLAFTMPTATAGNSSTSFVFGLTYSGFDTSVLSASSITLSGTATTGCSKSVVVNSTSSAIVTVTGCSGNGTLSVTSAAGTVSDLAGNSIAVLTSNTVSLDNVAPTIAIGSPSPALGSAGVTMAFVVTYSGADAISLSASNVSFGGTATTGCVAAVSGTGTTTRTVSVSGCTADGSMTISIAANTASDLAGNKAPAAGPSSAVTLNNAPIGLAITTPSEGQSISPIAATFTVTGTCTYDASSPNITLTVLGAQTDSGNDINMTVPCSSNGTINSAVSAMYGLKSGITNYNFKFNQKNAYGVQSTVNRGVVIADPAITSFASPLSGKYYTSLNMPITLSCTAASTNSLSFGGYTNPTGGYGGYNGTSGGVLTCADANARAHEYWINCPGFNCAQSQFGDFDFSTTDDGTYTVMMYAYNNYKSTKASVTYILSAGDYAPKNLTLSADKVLTSVSQAATIAVRVNPSNISAPAAGGSNPINGSTSLTGTAAGVTAAGASIYAGSVAYGGLGTGFLPYSNGDYINFTLSGNISSKVQSTTCDYTVGSTPGVCNFSTGQVAFSLSRSEVLGNAISAKVTSGYLGNPARDFATSNSLTLTANSYIMREVVDLSGTTSVSDYIDPGSLVLFNSSIYFVGSIGTGGLGNQEQVLKLWKYDGTTVTKVSNTSGNNSVSDAISGRLYVVNNELYFFANDAASHSKLFKINTAGVITQVSNINNGNGEFGNIRGMINGILYLSAYSATLREKLYQVDASGVFSQTTNYFGSTVSDDFNNFGNFRDTGSYPQAFAKTFNGGVYGQYGDNSNPGSGCCLKIVKINQSTKAGTKISNTAGTGKSDSPQSFMVMNNELYFLANNTLGAQKLFKVNASNVITQVSNFSGNQAINDPITMIFNETSKSEIVMVVEASSGVNKLYTLNASGTITQVSNTSGSTTVSDNILLVALSNWTDGGDYSGNLYFTATNTAGASKLFKYYNGKVTQLSNLSGNQAVSDNVYGFSSIYGAVGNILYADQYNSTTGTYTTIRYDDASMSFLQVSDEALTPSIKFGSYYYFVSSKGKLYRIE